MEEFNALEQQVREIIAKQIDIDISKVKKDSSIASLGGDSLVALQLLSVFENHFNISIPDEDAVNIDSFKSAVDVIGKLLSK
jgi:acyl carrier protein